MRLNTATFAAKLGKPKIFLGNNISREKGNLEMAHFPFPKVGYVSYPQVGGNSNIFYVHP